MRDAPFPNGKGASGTLNPESLVGTIFFPLRADNKKQMVDDIRLFASTECTRRAQIYASRTICGKVLRQHNGSASHGSVRPVNGITLETERSLILFNKLKASRRRGHILCASRHATTDCERKTHVWRAKHARALSAFLFTHSGRGQRKTPGR